MDVGMLLLRLVHVGLGVFWAGAILFFVLLVEPSIRDAGPDGGKVMQAMMRRGYLNIMPAVAVLTVLSGVDLLRRASGGFSGQWLASATGLALSLGAVTGTLALLLGLSVLRPNAIRIGQLMQAVQGAEGGERDRLLGEVGSRRARATATGRIIAILLAVSVATMAVGRYLH